MPGRRYKVETVNVGLADAVDCFYSDAQEISEEMRESFENMPEGLQSTERGQTLEATADALDDIAGERPDDPECLMRRFPKETVAVSLMRGYGKRRGGEPRGTRMSNAASYVQSVVEFVVNWCDEHEDDASDDLLADIEELRDWCNTLEEHAENAEGCEFPGMYG